MFETLKELALSGIKQFIDSEFQLINEQKLGKIRYVGVFQNVKKAMLVVEYLVASCNLVCDQKVGGYDIIKKSLVLKICDWLLAVSNRDPKYTNLVQMENTFWMMDEIQRI